MRSVRIANAPLSYGAFEVTVGRYPNLPGPDELLAAMAGAGYEGTELGPPGYLGEGRELRERLLRSGLRLAGGYVPIHFSEPQSWEADFAELERTLELFTAAGDGARVSDADAASGDGAPATDARPALGPRVVLADAGSPLRAANPGRGAMDRSLGLDEGGWRRLADGVGRAAERARSRGFEPSFHHHTSSFVEAPWEIERLMELTDVDVLLDTGHLLLGGGDPLVGLADWGERINHVHLKDVRRGVLRGVLDDRADMLAAWRRGVFCELGDGDVDLTAFVCALLAGGYSGWLVVEQDRVPRPNERLSESADAQERNRRWLREHAGI